MITESLIRELVEEKIEGTPNYIVDVSIRPVNRISVFLDNDKGISIGDCIAVSKHVESKLNRDEEDFELEVSSAGIDRPLKLVRQYKKHIGKNVSILTNEGKKIEGKLSQASDTGINVVETIRQKIAGKKQLISQDISLTFDQIKETKLIISL